MKKIITLVLFTVFSSTYLSAQNTTRGLKFMDAYYLQLDAEYRANLRDNVILRRQLEVKTGQVLEITSTSFGYVQSFEKHPNSITENNQVEIFINDCLISIPPQTNNPSIRYPIWLPEGDYQLEIKSTDLPANSVVRAFISGIIYSKS